jgi:hypothetical protein
MAAARRALKLAERVRVDNLDRVVAVRAADLQQALVGDDQLLNPWRGLVLTYRAASYRREPVR